MNRPWQKSAIAIALAASLSACATTRAYDSYTNGLEALRLGHLDQAIADFTLAIEADETLDEYFSNRARAYEVKQLYTNAIADLERAIRVVPKDYPEVRATYHMRIAGICLVQTTNYQGAIQSYESAKNLYETDPYIRAHDPWRDFRIVDLNRLISEAKQKLAQQSN